jgi:hypothetical protein
MADNTTTYTAVVDVKVEGDDQMQELGDKTKETEGKFKSLRAQIRETTVALQKLADEGKEGTKEFKELADKLDDLGDQQKRVAFQAGQIEDKLAALPGPIGQIGKGFASLKESIDTFGKGLTVSLGIVGLLVAAFFAIKDAMSKTKEGQENLSKAMTAFNQVLSPIFAILEQIGNAILPIVTKGFEVLGEVMAKVAKFFGASDAKIKEVHTSLEKNNELVQKNAEAQKKAAEDLKKQKEEEAKKHEETLAKKKAADEKAAAERKKKAEEEAKIQAEASKVLTDAYIATLSQRDQELFKAGQAHNERMLALEKAGVKDKTSVLEQYKIETAAINKKYDDEAAKKAEEDKKKKEDDQKKLDEDAKKAAEDKLKQETQDREDKISLYQADFDLKKANNDATFQDQRDLFEKSRELERENLVANKASADAITAYDKETAAMRIQNKKEEEAIKLQAVSQALDSVASLVDQNSAAGKAISVAQAIINTYQGATAALGAYPPPFNFIAAAAVTAAGLVNVNKILTTKIPSITGEGNVATSAAGTATPPTAPSIPSIAAPQVQTTGGTNPTSQIASTLAAASGKPIKAYVVSQDIQSQTALDRRTNRAATFSGG